MAVIIKISNGEIRYGYLIDELGKRPKEKAIKGLRLEWLDETEEEIISDAMSSEFLFDEEGGILPIYIDKRTGKERIYYGEKQQHTAEIMKQQKLF